MAAGGPSIVFTDQENKLYGALYMKHKSGEWSDERVNALLKKNGPEVEGRYRCYAQIKEELDAKAASLQKETQVLQKNLEALQVRNMYLNGNIKATERNINGIIETHAQYVVENSDRIIIGRQPR